MAFATAFHLPQQGVFARAAATVSDFFAHAIEYRRVFDELNAMTDRDLDDLGIARAAIRDVAREAAYGK